MSALKVQDGRGVNFGQLLFVHWLVTNREPSVSNLHHEKLWDKVPIVEADDSVYEILVLNAWTLIFYRISNTTYLLRTSFKSSLSIA